MRTWFALFAASISIVVTVAACGARTGLPIPKIHADAGIEEEEDAGPDVEDAFDAPDEPDVEDPFPDVVVTDCQDAGITYVYLISSQNALLRFYPPDLSVVTIGTINCPTTSPANPFSMAVDRQGIAYVLFDNGELFRVSTLTASCKATSFKPGQDGFNSKFGMGFSANTSDPGETLYVAGTDVVTANAISSFGTIDPKTFHLTMIGPASQYIGNPELTGTGDARLYGFGPTTPLSHFAEIDKPTAKVVNDVLIDLDLSFAAAWAFAFWGGDFYFFTAQQPGGSSVVHRYTPGQTTKPPQVADIGLTIVGAGVSTCAPSE